MKVKIIVYVILFLSLISFASAQETKSILVSLGITGTENATTIVEDTKITKFTDFKAEIVGIEIITRKKAIKERGVFGDDYFTLILQDDKSSALKEVKFQPNFLKPESAELEESVYPVIDLPYYDNAKTVKLLYKGKELLSTDVQPLLCNNDGKCSGYENVLSCAADCKPGAKDDLCTPVQDGSCDPDCRSGDPDCYSYPKTAKFSPSLTTNFTEIDGIYLDYLSNIKLGIEGKGQIDFQDSTINVNGADLDKGVILGNG